MIRMTPGEAAGPRPDDVVLVQGSRYRTWEVADALRVHAAAEEVSP
ncbi:hypothetical protein [Couchioplanes caeruleus]|nr:hypothetical protein [Couchioplanes caeruleus]